MRGRHAGSGDSARRPRFAGPSDPSPEGAHAAALDVLSRCEHSRRELARKLRRRGYARETIEGVLDRLEAVGLVSDARYARLFVRDRLAVRPQGRRRILAGLRAKGVAAEVAGQAVKEIYGEEGASDRDTAEALARHRWRLLRSLDPAVARRRLADFLARRGYDAAVVADVVRRVAATQ